jgi:hypothetical protein
MIEKMRKFHHLIGFCGTTLNQIDHQILECAFNTVEVKFPKLK